MAHDSWQQQVETSASRTLVAAAITAACTWIANQFRCWAERRKEQRALAANVAAVRDVVNPPGDDLPDLGARVNSIENGLCELTRRFDANLDRQQDQHAELCKLILESRK